MADEDKCKSHLVVESNCHSSWANLSRVADSTDIAGLTPRHIFEAKSISKQPANARLWIRSWADLRIPITPLVVTAKDAVRGRQTDRQAGRWADKRAQGSEKETDTLLALMRRGVCVAHPAQQKEKKKKKGTKSTMK